MKDGRREAPSCARLRHRGFFNAPHEPRTTGRGATVNKQTSLRQAVSLIEDGDAISVGGTLLHRTPAALAREIARGASAPDAHQALAGLRRRPSLRRGRAREGRQRHRHLRGGIRAGAQLSQGDRERDDRPHRARLSQRSRRAAGRSLRRSLPAHPRLRGERHSGAKRHLHDPGPLHERGAPRDSRPEAGLGAAPRPEVGRAGQRPDSGKQAL